MRWLWSEQAGQCPGAALSSVRSAFWKHMVVLSGPENKTRSKWTIVFLENGPVVFLGKRLE